MALSLLRKLRGGAAAPGAGEDQAPRTKVTGLHGNVRLHSEFGLVPVALLRKGDKLRTLEGGIVTIAAMDGFRFDHAMMEARPDLRPIRIPAGALGAGLPLEDVMVAPDQLLGGDPRQGGAALTPAIDMLDRAGIGRAAPTETGYYAPRLVSPAVILAEGLRIRA